MDLVQYFSSLSREVDSLKNRVRNLKTDPNWLTDGEWKESVIRQVLRRNLPGTIEVSRGFVVTKSRASSQLDIVIRDASKPVLFRDGDLAFVTPDAVLGIIEVKPSVTAGEFEASVAKLGRDMELVRIHPNYRAFAGLFSYESENTPGPRLLERMARVVIEPNQRIDFAAVGNSIFIRYWEFDPLDVARGMYEFWHSYDLLDLAAGYFIHNVIDAISPESVFSNREVWFPEGGKEPYRTGRIQAAWAQDRSTDHSSGVPP